MLGTPSRVLNVLSQQIIKECRLFTLGVLNNVKRVFQNLIYYCLEF